jgi:hypothetical protein
MAQAATYRLAIDPATSRVTHEPGTLFVIMDPPLVVTFDAVLTDPPGPGETSSAAQGPSVTQPLPTAAPAQVVHQLSGTLLLETLVFEWDQSPPGTPISPPIVETWLRFTEASLALDPSDPGFPFPLFMLSRLQGTSFSGTNGPCDGPFPPGTLCSGFSTGLPDSMAGSFDGSRLVLDGSTGHSFSGPYYTFHIEAVATPLPAAGVLLLSAIPLLGGLARRRRRDGGV